MKSKSYTAAVLKIGFRAAKANTKICQGEPEEPQGGGTVPWTGGISGCGQKRSRLILKTETVSGQGDTLTWA